MIEKLKKILYQSLNLYKNFGFKITFYNFIAYLSKNNIRIKFTKKKQRRILQYLLDKYQNVINAYSGEVQNYTDNTSQSVIWVFWMQGYDAAPDMIKTCINSIKENANGFPVILLDKNNCREYIEMPPYIEDKQEKGIISWTHFSDILRCAILSRYKGLWLDATVLLTDKLPKNIMQSDFWSVKLEYNENITSLSYYRWNTALMKSNQIFSLLYELWLEYWKYENYIIDYFLLDYFLEIAYQNFPFYHSAIDHIPISNPNIFKLKNLLNTPYDAKKYAELQKTTSFFKLQRRDKIFEETSDGKQTYYGYIKNRYHHFC